MKSLQGVLLLVCVLCVMGGVAVWWVETKIRQVSGAVMELPKKALDTVSGVAVEVLAGDQIREAHKQLGDNIAKGMSNIDFLPGVKDRKQERLHKAALDEMAAEITEKAKEEPFVENHPLGYGVELQLLERQLSILEEYEKQGLLK